VEKINAWIDVEYIKGEGWQKVHSADVQSVSLTEFGASIQSSGVWYRVKHTGPETFDDIRQLALSSLKGKLQLD